MKKTLYVSISLIILSITFFCQGHSLNDLEEFETHLCTVDEIETILLLKGPYFYIGTLWIVEKNRVVQRGLWLNIKERDLRFELLRGQVNSYNYNSGEVSLVRYLPEEKITTEIMPINEKTDSLVLESYPWADRPRRFLSRMKYVSNINNEIRKFKEEIWKVYTGEFDFTNIKNYALTTDVAKGKLEIWIRADRNIWIEVYKKNDNTIFAIREGRVNKHNKHLFSIPKSSETLLMEYCDYFRNSAIEAIKLPYW